MNASRGGGAGNGGGAQPVPAGSRKMVQRLKEIVNCSEAEIYAALKDCNMDPNEAVNRLLSQDPFHEVKSKREKKKEGKDATDSRSCGASNNSTRGSKLGVDRYGGHGGSTPYNSSDSGPRPVKSSYKKENESAPYSSSLSSVPGMSGNYRSRGSTGLSNGWSFENDVSLSSTDDVMPATSIQPSSGLQSPWTVAPGQVSMADIVKRGRPHDRTSSAPKASNSNVLAPRTNVLHDRYPEDHTSKDPESVLSSVNQVPIHDEWPIIEKPATKVSSVSEVVHSEKHLEPSGIPSESINQHSEEEDVEESDDESIDNSVANDVGLGSIPTGKIEEDDPRGVSLFENDLYKNIGPYENQPQEVNAGEETGTSVSSVTRNMQRLGVGKEDRGQSHEGCVTSVLIPDHLQVQNVDCSHLSFGTFGSRASATYPSGTTVSMPEKPKLEEPHAEGDVSSVGPPDSRSTEYYADDSLRNVSDSGLFHRAGVSAGTYETSSVSQPEVLKPENSERIHGDQYPFPSPNTGYSFDDAQHLNTAFSQTSSQMQNLSPFSNVMSYTNSLPSSLSPANAHPSRESELHQYSPFPLSQSLSAKYGISSIGASSVSLSEALKTASFTSTPAAPPTLSGSNAASGPPLPQQHLTMHPYNQPTLPLGPFANMIGYPFLPQSYTYMPSAFQQTFAGNNTYHQSLAAVLPQYKNSLSAGNMPQSAAIASGYGALGSNTAIPGNFPINAPAAPSATGLSYDEVLSTQYKDASHLVSLQQNDNSAMWLHGLNSRTMSGVPANSYYNNYGAQQNQQSSGFRQGQQPSQNQGLLGYPNMYHSQASLSLEQQLNPRDGSLGMGGPQGQPRQSQIWQNSY
ncbi:uncharacterized protein LOC127249818 [Andrographis paniculata]|uniref:uncharacterized protein LOC127249818 n=1 Tax=Andrographis paniculata TaxID=175694 RepID=UPI0021E94501|nr:uncharacterized protein LOC127249818 [Andrographis paniculata]